MCACVSEWAHVAFFSRDKESFYQVLIETFEPQEDESLSVLKILDLEPVVVP